MPNSTSDEEKRLKKNEYSRKWRKENPEKVNKTRTKESKARANKLWLERHPDYYKEYREKNRDRIRAYDNEWHRKIKVKDENQDVPRS